MTRLWITRALLFVACALAGGGAHTATAQDADAGLGARLRARFDVVALQQGVALVPRTPSAVRLIQIADGVVTVDGEALTGRELRDRLGEDADLVLQASYLDAQAQRELAVLDDAPPVPAPTTGTAAPAPAPRRRGPDGEGRRRDGSDRVRFGGGVDVDRGERIQGDAVAIFGSADIQGEVDGDVVAVMGSVTLGPEAVVRGDVTAVGGQVTRAPGAQVEGDLNEVGIGGRGPDFSQIRRPDLIGPFWPRVGGVAAVTLRIGLLLLLALVVVAAGRGEVERIGARSLADPLRAGLVGLLAEVLVVPVVIVTSIVLAVSIVGIPLLALVPFGLVALAILMLVGYTGVALELGRVLGRRFGWDDSPYVSVIAGVVITACLTLVGRLAGLAGGTFLATPLTAIGFIVEYLAWTLGLGAILLVWFGSRQRIPQPPVSPPPIPGQA